MKYNKKRTLKLTLAGKVVFSTITLIALLFALILQQSNMKLQAEVEAALADSQRLIDQVKEEQMDLERQLASIAYVTNVGNDATSYEVIITNYGLWDGESGSVTASGLTIDDFDIVDGFYKYEGMDVIATANTTRLNRPLKAGYQSWELYDVIVYELFGELRTGIVLDVCGACYGVDREEYQRIDVFTTHSVIGKAEGKIYE